MKKTFIGYLVLVALISAFSAKTIGEIFGYIPTYTFVIDFFVLISPTVVCGLIRLQSNRLSLLQKCLLSLSMIVTVILTGHEVFTNTMGAKNAIVTCNPHSWNITVMIECIFCLVCILVIRERKEPIRYGEILKKYLDEKDLTVSTFAIQCSMLQKDIVDILEGKRTPSPDENNSISNALGIEPFQINNEALATFKMFQSEGE